MPEAYIPKCVIKSIIVAPGQVKGPASLFFISNSSFLRILKERTLKMVRSG